jgi:hypothetical protein
VSNWRPDRTFVQLEPRHAALLAFR